MEDGNLYYRKVMKRRKRNKWMKTVSSIQYFNLKIFFQSSVESEDSDFSDEDEEDLEDEEEDDESDFGGDEELSESGEDWDALAEKAKKGKLFL